jgi:hypothetical protein
MFDKFKSALNRRKMADVQSFPVVEGDKDAADLNTDAPVPSGWKPESDASEFKAKDKDVNPDG